MKNKIEFSCLNIEKISKVADRLEDIEGGEGFIKAAHGRMSYVMDLQAADGVNGNPAIDWDRLLAADDFNFIHDATGISSHIDRNTGKIGNCFMPRFAVKH